MTDISQPGGPSNHTTLPQSEISLRLGGLAISMSEIVSDELDGRTRAAKVRLLVYGH